MGPHSKHLKFDKDVGTIRQGYLSDNAVKCSLKKKDKVYIINSVEAKYFHRKGFLTAKIAVLRDQANIEDIFVILHFDGPPQHFACLHVKKSSMVYYDSLPNNNSLLNALAEFRRGYVALTTERPSIDKVDTPPRFAALAPRVRSVRVCLTHVGIARLALR